MRKLSILFVSILSFSFIGCQSAMKSARDAGQGNFRTRTLVKDNKQTKSFIVNLNFNVERGEAIRMDATSPLNQHLASFLITPKTLTFFIVPERTYYKGAARANAFARFMAVPLEPMWLENILFREAFEDKNWNCTKNSSGHLVSCLNKGEKLSVEWSEGQDKKQIVKVSHSQGEIQMNIHRISPKVESGVSLTALDIPKGFRQIK